MNSMKSKSNPRKDFTQIAFDVVRKATGEIEHTLTPEQPLKNKAAVELGRLGGRKGGKARAENLTPEQRSEIAKKAARVRWKKE